jgi:hypothetical protein
VVEHKHEAMSSIPSTAKKQQQLKGGRKKEKLRMKMRSGEEFDSQTYTTLYL